MDERLSKEQLIALVTKIINAEGTEEELDQYEDLLQRNVPHPEVSDLIFYPDSEMTAEEIVERALAYEPIRLPGSSSDDHGS